MADTFVKNPKLIVGTQAQIESEISANDIGFATDVEFYTKNQIDELLENSGGASLPILMQIWSDHVLNNISWLRADTFSWQSGDVYVAAYNHLANDIDGKTLQSETIGSTTIQFYLADDGHKICPDTEENSVSAIYNATGVAWYYILDTTNKRFKLPRTKWGFAGIRDGVGNYIAESLPNIKGEILNVAHGRNVVASASGAFKQSVGNDTGNAQTTSGQTNNFYLDASTYSETYQDNAPVQQRATQMYLYFYVGNFEQSAVEQTAGITAETLNGKADADLGNLPTNYDYVVESQMPTAENGYTWYRKYKSGWVEQGGIVFPATSTAARVSVTLPITMGNNVYSVQVTGGDNMADTSIYSYYTNRTTTGFEILHNHTTSSYTIGDSWQVSGMSAQ